MANCTGNNAQYSMRPHCISTCGAFAPGASGAMTGNNLACRAYHATAAAGSAANATLHCPHAGPAGDGSAFCGTNCESFCALQAAICTGNNVQYASMTECTNACNGFTGVTGHYNSTTTTGNNFACRMYHLTVASQNATSMGDHCPHTKAVPTAGCN